MKIRVGVACFGCLLFQFAEAKLLSSVAFEKSQSWVLTSKGSIAQSVRFSAAGTYTFKIKAYGTPADGVWPMLELRLDGVGVQKAQITSPSPADYALTASVKGGSHEVAIAFINDKQTATEDRNLSVYSIDIEGAAGAASPASIYAADMPIHTSGRPGMLLETHNNEGAQPYSHQIESNIVRAGKHSLRSELRIDDPIVGHGKRSEVQPPSNGAGKIGAERWFGFSVFLPGDWINDTPASHEIVFQVHDVNDPCESARSPPLHLSIEEGDWVIGKIWNPLACDSTKPGGPSESFHIGPLQKGKWTDFVIHARWSYNPSRDPLDPAAGILQVWKDGHLVLDDVGPNYFNDQNSGYVKFGLYKWTWKDPDAAKKSVVRRRYLYHDEFKMGDAKSSYTEVSPEGASPAVEAFPALLSGPTMPIQTGGGMAVDLPGGGKGWKITRNGYNAQNVRFTADGAYTFDIQAAGNFAGNKWSQFELRIDGQKVGATQTAASATLATYQIVAPSIKAGRHEVAVVFINDYYQSTSHADRNLILESVRIQPGSGGH